MEGSSLDARQSFPGLTDDRLEDVAFAERVASFITDTGASFALIGAWAMLVYGYDRPTADLDLGVVVDLDDLRVIADRTAAAGLKTALRTPDPWDPLGGVLDVEFGDYMVQVVNFRNNANALGGELQPLATEAIASAVELPELSDFIRVVPLGHLVALKLAPWDRETPHCKPVRDVHGLVEANPSQVHLMREVCNRFGLGDALERALALRH